MKRTLVLLAITLLAFSAQAWAQVESNFAAGGGVRIGGSSSTCNSTIEGAIRYNSAAGGSIDYCNGTAWLSTGASGGLNNLDDAYTNYTVGNMVLGHKATTFNATSPGNTALGASALSSYSGTAGYNTGIGYRALASLAGGYGGFTGVGARALENQTGGMEGTAFGFSAARAQVSADGTTAIGFGAMANNLDHNNTCVGSNCLSGLVYGQNNIALGYNSGGAINNGSNNIIIGANVAGQGGISNQLNIGNLIYGDMSANKFVGINKVTPLYALDVTGDIAYTGVLLDISDGRLKEDVQPLPSALPKVMSLKPVSYNMKNDATKKTEYGFIAQEVEEVYPVVVKTAEDEDHTRSLNYIGLIAPLVKTFQEQQVLIENQDARIKALEEKLLKKKAQE